MPKNLSDMLGEAVPVQLTETRRRSVPVTSLFSRKSSFKGSRESSSPSSTNSGSPKSPSHLSNSKRVSLPDLPHMSFSPRLALTPPPAAIDADTGSDDDTETDKEEAQKREREVRTPRPVLTDEPEPPRRMDVTTGPKTDPYSAHGLPSNGSYGFVSARIMHTYQPLILKGRLLEGCTLTLAMNLSPFDAQKTVLSWFRVEPHVHIPMDEENQIIWRAIDADTMRNGFNCVYEAENQRQYTLSMEDVGKRIVVRCSCLLSHRTFSVVSSSVIQLITEPTIIHLRVTGEFSDGHFLQIEKEYRGPTEGQCRFTWFRSVLSFDPRTRMRISDQDLESGGFVSLPCTLASYTPTAEDVGAVLKVECIPVSEDGVTGEPVSAYTDLIIASEPRYDEFWVKGEAREGERLQCRGIYHGGFEGPSEWEWFRFDKNGDRTVLKVGILDPSCPDHAGIDPQIHLLDQSPTKSKSKSKALIMDIHHVRCYTLTLEDVGFEVACQVVPVRQDGVRGEPCITSLKAKVRAGQPSVRKMKIVAVSSPEEEDQEIDPFCTRPNYNCRVKIQHEYFGGIERDSSIQWYRKTEDSIFAPIPGATDMVFQPTVDEIDNVLQVIYTPRREDGAVGDPRCASFGPLAMDPQIEFAAQAVLAQKQIEFQVQRASKRGASVPRILLITPKNIKIRKTEEGTVVTLIKGSHSSEKLWVEINRSHPRKFTLRFDKNTELYLEAESEMIRDVIIIAIRAIIFKGFYGPQLEYKYQQLRRARTWSGMSDGSRGSPRRKGSEDSVSSAGQPRQSLLASIWKRKSLIPGMNLKF